MNASRFLKKLWADEEGQTTTEYILILAVAVMIAMKLKTELVGPNGKISALLNKVMGDAEKFTEN